MSYEELIREQDPLKQGLKLDSAVKRNRNRPIREQDPLKQGLKLFPFSRLKEYRYSRARSIKTRIET